MTLKSRLICAVAISCVCCGIAGINHHSVGEIASWAILGFGIGLLTDAFLGIISSLLG